MAGTTASKSLEATGSMAGTTGSKVELGLGLGLGLFFARIVVPLFDTKQVFDSKHVFDLLSRERNACDSCDSKV